MPDERSGTARLIRRRRPATGGGAGDDMTVKLATAQNHGDQTLRLHSLFSFAVHEMNTV
jgi:hypothetical protein